MAANKKPKTLKLYVWEDVLTDNASGIIVALAYDVKQARQIILDKDNSMSVRDDIAKKPRVCRKSEAFVVWGGS